MNIPLLLPHEHVFSRHRVTDRVEAVAFLSRALHDAARAGVTDIVDLTAYVNPTTFLPVIQDSPVRLHACVGFYLDRMVRRDVREKQAADLARLLIDRHRRYSRQLSVVAIKVAARHSRLTDFEDRAFQAAAACHFETGLPIVTHSADGALSHQRRLVELGVAPDRILLSHPELALKGRSKRPYGEVLAETLELVARGSSVCITDLFAPGSPADAGSLDLAADIVEKGGVDRVLLSGDVSWRVRRGLGSFRGTTSSAARGFCLALSAQDKLISRGVTRESVHQIVSINPFNFYRISRPGS